MEIFSTYGTIKNIDMPSERAHPEFSRGFCYIEYDKPEEAENAVKFMDGGKIFLICYYGWSKVLKFPPRASYKYNYWY